MKSLYRMKKVMRLKKLDTESPTLFLVPPMEVRTEKVLMCRLKLDAPPQLFKLGSACQHQEGKIFGGCVQPNLTHFFEV